MIDEPRLRRLGARGIVHPGGNALQIVLGPIADQVAGEMRAAMRAPRPVAGAGDLFAALGGQANVVAVEAGPSRLRIGLGSGDAIDLGRLDGLGLRGFALASPICLHVLTDPGAPSWAEDVVAAFGAEA
jgi:PTS system N-acetylglucosamine-specific IIC component